MYGDTFERLFSLGSEAVLAGTHRCDTPPAHGGARWGLSVVFRFEDAAAARLDGLTTEALALAGAHHWPTGAAMSSHLTVRSLEPHRVPVPDDDAAVSRYTAALGRAARAIGPVRLAMTGLTLTPVSVMACAAPLDSAADDFAGALAAALGEDGWYEADSDRDIWYANLVHFTGVVAEPAGLVDWVSGHRRVDLGETTVRQVELTRWRFNGAQMVPVRLAVAPLYGERAAAPPLAFADDRRR